MHASLSRSAILAVACLIDGAGCANIRVYSVKKFKDAMLPMSVLTPNPSIISKELVNLKFLSVQNQSHSYFKI
jgi:hypothetical protein